MSETKYRPNYQIDLHCHTTRSDGSDTPQELIDHAALLGMKVIAMTDHDIRPAKYLTVAETGEKVAVAKYAAEKGVVVLPGIEVSCETTAEDCHIVCFGCNWDDPYFDRLERDVVASKVESYRKLTEELTKAGMPVTWDEVLANGGYPVEEDQVQKKMVFELMARKGYTKDWSEAKLLVKNTPEFQIQRRKPDPCDVIQAIHSCNGIAIMAHPYLVNEPVRLPSGEMTRADYIERLIKAGLDGIEACYTYGKTSYSGIQTAEEIEQEVRKRYSHRLSIISGGSDYHADAKKGVKNARQLGEAGITEEAFYNCAPLMRLYDMERA